MPFSLINTLVNFQRIINHILEELLYEYIIVYLDDILIFSKTFEEYI